jgi:Transcriptional regulatory protein, C terminal
MTAPHRPVIAWESQHACYVNRPPRVWQSGVMPVATVFLVGIDQLEQIPEFLELGSIVVVAPDKPTLRRWRWEQEDGIAAPDIEPGGGSLVVDLAARRISSRGLALDLSDMEFRVLAGLLAEPSRALGYSELRRLGWGDEPHQALDVYSIRSLVQRLRAKLRAAGAPVTIVAVRGFGFRAERGERPDGEGRVVSVPDLEGSAPA